MDEHPVALATIIRSPKSWVTSLMYGVSPQPPQARDRLEEVPALPLDVTVIGDGLHVDGLVARVGLALGRTDVDAHAAARAIVRRDLDRESVVGELARSELLVEEVDRRALDRGCREDLHPDRRVRADHRALAAIDAD